MLKDIQIKFIGILLIESNNLFFFFTESSGIKSRK